MEKKPNEKQVFLHDNYRCLQGSSLQIQWRKRRNNHLENESHVTSLSQTLPKLFVFPQVNQPKAIQIREHDTDYFTNHMFNQ